MFRNFRKILGRIKRVISTVLKEYILFDILAICRILHIPIQYRKYNKISGIKNRHAGERCFIIATGPSLAVEDIELVKDEITIGINSGFKIYNQVKKYKPTYYACTDSINFQRMSDEFDWELAQMCKREFFVNKESVNKIKKMKNSDNYIALPICALDHLIHPNSTKFRFSKNLLWGVYGTYTVVNVAIQVAAYMGIREIYLLGVDCNYTSKKTYAFEDSTKAWMKDETYETKRNRELAMIEGYKYMNKQMKKLGVHVYNASRGGKLDVFDKVNISDIIKN